MYCNARARSPRSSYASPMFSRTTLSSGARARAVCTRASAFSRCFFLAYSSARYDCTSPSRGLDSAACSNKASSRSRAASDFSLLPRPWYASIRLPQTRKSVVKLQAFLEGSNSFRIFLFLHVEIPEVGIGRISRAKLKRLFQRLFGLGESLEIAAIDIHRRKIQVDAGIVRG